MTVIGYARPQAGQPDSLQRQRRQLLSAGAERVVLERAATPEAVPSGRDRPRLNALIAGVEPGQVLMFTSADRPARSLSHLVTVAETITARGADVVFLSEDIAATGPDGVATTRTLAALVELDRVLRAARTTAGPTAVAAALEVTRPTLHRYLHPTTPASDAEPPT